MTSLEDHEAVIVGASILSSLSRLSYWRLELSPFSLPFSEASDNSGEPVHGACDVAGGEGCLRSLPGPTLVHKATSMIR